MLGEGTVSLAPAGVPAVPRHLSPTSLAVGERDIPRAESTELPLLCATELLGVLGGSLPPRGCLGSRERSLPAACNFCLSHPYAVSTAITLKCYLERKEINVSLQLQEKNKPEKTTNEIKYFV